MIFYFNVILQTINRIQCLLIEDSGISRRAQRRRFTSRTSKKFWISKIFPEVQNTRGVSSCHRTYWYRADFACPHFCDINFGLFSNFGEPLSIILPSPSLFLPQERARGRGEDDWQGLSKIRKQPKIDVTKMRTLKISSIPIGFEIRRPFLDSLLYILCKIPSHKDARNNFSLLDDILGLRRGHHYDWGIFEGQNSCRPIS